MCPWHGYEFSIWTGRHPGHPHLRLKQVAVKLRDGEVYVVEAPVAPLLHNDAYAWIDRMGPDLLRASRELVETGEAARVSDEAVAQIMTAAIRTSQNPMARSARFAPSPASATRS